MLKRKKIINVIIGVAVVAMIIISVVFYIYKNSKNALPALPREQTAIIPPEPKKTDFGTKVPTDFPADIPVENGVKVEQSYSLNYVGQKQLTIVLLSTKTVKENYSLYSDFLKKQNWNVLNAYDNPTVSSLYGTKENVDINVTISENTSTTSIKSQLSISVLKKL